jgi:hypothetical protein
MIERRKQKHVANPQFLKSRTKWVTALKNVTPCSLVEMHPECRGSRHLQNVNKFLSHCTNQNKVTFVNSMESVVWHSPRTAIQWPYFICTEKIQGLHPPPPKRGVNHEAFIINFFKTYTAKTFAFDKYL